MNLSAVGQKLVAGLKDKHKQYAVEYLLELERSVNFLNRVKRDADRCEFMPISRGFSDDVCVNSDEFDLFGTKFEVQLVFSEGGKTPSLSIIREVK